MIRDGLPVQRQPRHPADQLLRGRQRQRCCMQSFWKQPGCRSWPGSATGRTINLRSGCRRKGYTSWRRGPTTSRAGTSATLMTGQRRRLRLHSKQPQTAGRALLQSRSRTVALARRRQPQRRALAPAGDAVGCGGGLCCCGASPGLRPTWSPCASGACWCVPALVARLMLGPDRRVGDTRLVLR